MCRRTMSRLAAGLCLMLVVPAAATADDELVQRVRDGHRAAREAVRTLTATVTYEQVHPKQVVMRSARYWRSGNTARIQEGHDGKSTEDSLMKGGEVRRLSRQWTAGKPTPTAGARREAGDTLLGRCDAWGEMLIEMIGPDGGQLDLDRVLDTADVTVRATRDTLDGRKCVRLQYGHTYRGGAKTKATQWHDIGRNYLICKLVVELASSGSVLEVTDWVEASPGVVFPVRVRADHSSKSEVYSSTVTTLSDVVINKPIPATALALPAVPRGTVLKDYIENNEGPIAADWKPVGKMQPMAPRPVLGPPQAPAAQPSETGPSTAEPASSARWVMIGSAGVLLVAGVVAAARRIRVGRQPAT